MSNNFFNFPNFDQWDHYPVLRMSFLLLVYSFLPLMISSNMIGFAYRNEVGMLFAVFLIGYSYLRGISMKELGFRIDNIYQALQQFIPAIAVVLIGLFSAYYSGQFTLHDCQMTYYFIIFYFFVSAPLQEFCYRGLLLAEMNRGNYFSERTKIVGTTVIFSMLHIIYFHWVMFFLSIGMGLMWAYLYQKTPNFIAASIAHFVVGITAFWLGLAC